MWHYRSLHRHVCRELLNAFGRSPAKILDAGCGTGGLIRRLIREVPAWEWTGLDAVPLACQLARERSGGTVVEGRVETLPFGDEEFDAVVSADVLYTLKDDQSAIRESFRVLRPGGVIIVNVPAYQWLWSYHDVATHAQRRYQGNELVNKIGAAGFGQATNTHWNALTLPLIIFRRKVLPAPLGGSDVKAYPVLIDKALDAFMKVEHAWIGMGGRWSFGASELAVARKPKTEPSGSGR